MPRSRVTWPILVHDNGLGSLPGRASTACDDVDRGAAPEHRGHEREGERERHPDEKGEAQPPARPSVEWKRLVSASMQEDVKAIAGQAVPAVEGALEPAERILLQ